MTNQLRFSVLVLPNVPWPELLRRCQQVEALGFDSIGLADHLVDWAGGKGPWFELWSQLAAIAQATTRVRLTTLVAQIPLRNPALLALQALTADHISGGRLDVGLGIGLEVDPSYRMMGIENWSAKERVARFGEYVEIVDRLLSQEETTFQGRFYKVDAAALRPRPRAVTASAHRDRRDGTGHAGSCRAPCRCLEQHQLRQDLRGPARRDA